MVDQKVLRAQQWVNATYGSVSVSALTEFPTCSGLSLT